MNAVTLCYHDIIENNAFDGSGFPGASAASYKLDVAQFREHLRALQEIHPHVDACTQEKSGCPLLLTFDDGGSSALRIADLLEERHWKGHFLVTAKYIDHPGFVSAPDLRELQQRGHVVGSHSWSHPERMSRCEDAVLDEEWQRSVNRLAEILGTRVETASVPGGFHSQRVARSAARAGIRVLFTSEPQKRVERVEDCRIFGRYSIHRRTSSSVAAALASPRWNVLQQQQFILWNTKKALKAVGGNTWHVMREAWWRQRAKKVNS